MARAGRWTMTGGLLLAAALPCAAQSYPNEPFGDASFPLSRQRGPEFSLPSLTFSLTTEIPLPGPLPQRRPTVDPDGRVRIAVAGERTALVRLEPDAVPEFVSDASPSDDGHAGSDDGWAYSPDGKRRFRVAPDGHVRAELCCTWFRQGWRKDWELRVPGGSVARPLAVEGRVFVGALDNQIYALRARNGHRIWTADVGQRVSNPLSLWSGPAPRIRSDGVRLGVQPTELILVVLDNGQELLALDAETGRRVAAFELTDSDGRLVVAAATTPEGGIAVPRQRFAESDASLLVLELVPPARPAPADPEEDAEVLQPDGREG